MIKRAAHSSPVRVCAKAMTTPNPVALYTHLGSGNGSQSCAAHSHARPARSLNRHNAGRQVLDQPLWHVGRRGCAIALGFCDHGGVEHLDTWRDSIIRHGTVSHLA